MRRVKEVMTPAPLVVRSDATVEACARRLDKGNIRHMPVVDDDGRFAGMITDFSVFCNGELLKGSDNLWVPYKTASALTAADMVGSESLIAGPDDDLFGVIKTQLARHDECTVVVDVGQRPVGIVCEHDLVALAAKTLPNGLCVPQVVERSPVYSVTWSQPAIDAWELMSDHGVRHVLVMDEDRIEGVVSWRDLLRDGVPSGRRIMASECVRGPSIHVVKPGAPLREAAQMMVRHKVGSLPVADNRAPIDIITRTDIIRALLASFPDL